MDSDQDLLDAANARDDARLVAEWRLKKASQQRYESIAKQAHKFRRMQGLVLNQPVPDWEDMCLSSRKQLISDVENVAANPTITAAELHRLYQERLQAWGDADNEDLGTDTPMTEELVLSRLKQLLAES